jgi:F0F1-type ATP synthase membrane subunit a
MEAYDAPHILSIPPHAFAESGFLSSVTNTVFATWIFVVIVVVFASILYRARDHKTGFVHTTGFLIVKHLKAFFEPLLGHRLPLNKSLWFVGGVFIYIFGANLYSLLLDWMLAFLP